MAHPEKLLSFGITGSVSAATPLNRNPSYILSLQSIQKMLLETAREPKSRGAIQSALSGTDITLEDLVRTGLLEPAGERYRISFILFLKEDLEIIKSVTGELSRTLADTFLGQKPYFEEVLHKSTNPHNSTEDLAYILIGCFALDWDGLQITSEMGFRAKARPTELGDRYITWAEERQYEAVQGIFWGSHNDYYPECVLTSFGDHCALPRTTFPDLAWRVEHGLYDLNLPTTIEQHLVQAFSPAIGDFAEQIGSLMLALAEGDRTLEDLAESLGETPEDIHAKMALLTSLDWIDGGPTTGYRPVIPVIPHSDSDMVNSTLTRSGEILVDWLPDHMRDLRQQLRALTPLKHGLTFEEIFSQIWHYLFGLTNQHLVSDGFFADPYSPNRRFKGFIATVWHPDVLPEETTFQ